MLLWENNKKLYISLPKGSVVNVNLNAINNIKAEHMFIPSVYQPQLLYPAIDILTNRDASPITYNLFRGAKKVHTAGFLYIRDIGIYRVDMYWNDDIREVSINLSLANVVKFISMDDITTDYINDIYRSRINAESIGILPFEEDGDECFIEMVKYYNEICPYRQGDIFKINLDTPFSDKNNGYICNLDLDTPPAEMVEEDNIDVNDDKETSTAKKSANRKPRKSTETN